MDGQDLSCKISTYQCSVVFLSADIHTHTRTERINALLHDYVDVSNDAGRHFHVYLLRNWIYLDETWPMDGGSGKSDSCNYRFKVFKSYLNSSDVSSQLLIILIINVVVEPDDHDSHARVSNAFQTICHVSSKRSY